MVTGIIDLDESPKYRKKFLIVEDDSNLGPAYKRTFGRFGDVTVATSAEEALEILMQGYKPDCILSDNDMVREGDGLRLIDSILNFGSGAGLNVENITIALYTGNELNREVISRLTNSGVGYFCKPVKNEILFSYFGLI